MKIILTTQRRKYVSNAGIFLITAVIITALIGFGGTCYRTSLPPSENLEIRTWYDLDDVRDNLRGNHTLMNDLDSSTDGYEELASPTANGGKGWEPIGFAPPQQYPTAFLGTFDGQGHEIRGLFIDRPDEICVGLFGVSGGFIKDTAVMNCTVTGDCVGGLLGCNLEHGGTVRNCYCSGKVTGDKRVGGLIGNNCGPVNNSYFTGSVTGNENVGGLLGFQGNEGTVSDSYSTGSVTGNENVGGLAGLNGGTVSNSYFNGNVSGQNVVGGLVGENGYKGNVSNSYSTGNVTGNSSVGGLVGSNAYYGFKGTVNNSFWDTETSGQATSDGGTGKNTTEMQDIATFSGVGWNIIAVALNETNPTWVWNIVNNVTYPFLSWQP
jgi:hypothetical protein